MNHNPAEIHLATERKLIPVTQWHIHHPWPPIGGLRHLIFNQNSNGFSHCIRRVGRKVLIDEARFYEWVEGLNKTPPHQSAPTLYSNRG